MTGPAAAEPRPKRLRLFVALALAVPARARLAGWARAELGEMAGLRLLDPELLHVTLAFLGWREPDDAERIERIGLAGLERCPAPLLRPRALAALPPRRPRVLAVDLDDRGGRAGALAGLVADRLAGAGLYEPERRPFRPHVTVARAPRAGMRPPARLPSPPGDLLHAPRVVLYRSELRRSGARYSPLAQVELAAPAPGDTAV